MELKINTTKLGGLKAVNFITDFLITNDITSFITTSKKETTFKIVIDVIPKDVINGLYKIIGDCSSVCKYELHK